MERGPPSSFRGRSKAVGQPDVFSEIMRRGPYELSLKPSNDLPELPSSRSDKARLPRAHQRTQRRLWAHYLSQKLHMSCVLLFLGLREDCGVSFLDLAIPLHPVPRAQDLSRHPEICGTSRKAS